MSRVVLGPIAHSGPNSHTEKRKSLAEMDGDNFPPTHADAALAAGAAREGGSGGGSTKKKAADWISEIEAAEDQESLDAVLAAYDESGQEFKTVVDAAEAKQTSLDGGDNNS